MSSEDSSMITSNWKAPGQMFEGTHYVYHTQPNVPHADIVLFIHGIGCYHTCFHYLIDAVLKEGKYAVLTYDLIGRGHSAPSTNERYGREEHLIQLTQLLQHLDIQRPMHVVGHSMGGCLATLFASEHPALVKTLTLLSPAGLLGYFPLQFLIDQCKCIHGLIKSSISPRHKQEREWRKDFVRKGAHQYIEDETVRDMHIMYDNNVHAFEAFYRSILHFPLTDIKKDIEKVAKNVNLPVYIQWGKKDQACPFSNLKVWEKLINKERRKEGLLMKKLAFDKAGHCFLLEFHEETSEGLLTIS